MVATSSLREKAYSGLYWLLYNNRAKATSTGVGIKIVIGNQ